MQPPGKIPDGRRTAPPPNHRFGNGGWRVNRARVTRFETRADEFAREQAPVLSPEQSIIAEQQAHARASNLASAARRLAVRGVDAKSLEAQGVASVALGAPTGEGRPDPAAPGAAPSEAVMSIITAIVNALPPR